jgi:hypothetical protein
VDEVEKDLPSSTILVNGDINESSYPLYDHVNILSSKHVIDHDKRNHDVEIGKENVIAHSAIQKDEVEPVKDTKSKRRFMGKRSRPRKKSNANADQVKKFEDKITGCDK